jgi:predicted RNase H-like HicB family nuclease
MDAQESNWQSSAMGASGEAGESNGGRAPKRRHSSGDIEIDAETGWSEMTKDFLVIFEKGNSGFGAEAPDIPGCFAVGPTLDAARERFIAAAQAHLEWLASDGDPIPEPITERVDLAEMNQEGSTFHTERLTIRMPSATRKRIPA